MTVPNGPILFNSSTGSDTAASGLGPIPAQSGTGASTTAGSAVVTGITTTGVSAGDLLWVESSSGRQFSIIASVDSGTQVTCDDNFDNTESGRNWAIGGKRATFDDSSSRLLFGANGAPPGSVIETESNQDLTSGIDLEASGVTIQGSGQALKTINQTSNSFNFRWKGSGGNGEFLYLKFTNSNAVKTSAEALTNTYSAEAWVAKHCIFGDSVNSLKSAFSPSTGGESDVVFSDCIIEHCLDHGIELDTRGEVSITRCVIRDCAGGGVVQPSGTNGQPKRITDCIVYGNGSTGIGIRVGTCMVARNIVFNNSGDGINALFQITKSIIQGNIISQNAGYGLNINAERSLIDGNALHANVTGNYNNISPGPNDIDLTANPFEDAANGDFNINNDPLGGALLRAATVTLP